MSDPNYVVITAANSQSTNTAGLFASMGDFAKECVENGAMRVTYGSVMSGRHPNALLFIQFFEDLSGFEKVMQAIPYSKPYQSIISDHSTTPFVRNVLRNVNIPFEPTLSPMPNFLVLTRARRQTLSEGEVVDLMNDTTSVFKENGAQTLRFGQTITGNDIGTYMLGVTYPSMSSIENTYTALGSNANFAKLSAGIDIDMRSITKIAGIV